MAKQLHEILAEVRTLPLDNHGLRRYFALLNDAYALLPSPQVQDAFNAALGNRQAEFSLALASYVEDQRAHDLIDQSSGAPHELAIPLLLQAVQYGETSLQAEKAYQDLGSRYEQLEQPDQAIAFFTKALVLDETNTACLFWRGELYFQLGELEAAQNDLVRAIATRNAQAYFPEEYSLAHQRLIELEQRKRAH